MRRRLWVLSAVGLLLVGTACSNPGHPAATTPKSTTPAAGAGTVRVYFMRADKVATAGRQLASSTKDQTVQALLLGPNDFERSIGMSTDIPAGTKLLGLDVKDGTATANLSDDFQPGGAALQPTQPRVAEIVFTLTQFQDVRQVTITLNGKPLEGAAGLERGDLEAVTPKILVESPVPAAPVTSPLAVSGAANVFEGTVSYSLQAPDGAELDHGFTTATQQQWSNWYAFTFTASYPSQQHGRGHVVVWETSMKDGSRVNVYDVPVNM
ncbi:Gmad2 immunoglobulin-like domain-containing protein [Mycobacterium paragordonae]|uniref:Gmad2 immunoglobulin-like domain-containing protein n=1 Tax=Mycobacterium paragordonae TaxID=1389713 RepID=UPI0018CC6D03|nr:Gmad2 immunoglobulin-like domain-containing protein [Mycobacterium paragordonae]